MPRIRQVQRNIKCTVCTCNVFDINTRQVKTTVLTIAGTYLKDEHGKSRAEKAVMTDIDEVAVGSVILFNADANGVVSKYAVIAKLVNHQLKLTDAASECVDAEDDANIYLGYLETREKKSKGDVIDVVTADGTENFTVKSGANKYTFNDAGRNVVIEIGDYMAEDVYVAEENEDGGKCKGALRGS